MQNATLVEAGRKLSDTAQSLSTSPNSEAALKGLLSAISSYTEAVAFEFGRLEQQVSSQQRAPGLLR